MKTKQYFLLFCLSLLFILNLQAQEEAPAIIYFYRSASIKGAAINYDVYDSSKLVGKMTPGQVLIYSARPGVHTFTARTESTAAAIIDAKPGRLYFVQCGVSIGAIVYTPFLRQVTSKTGIAAIRKINPALTINEALVGEATLDESDFKADTVRALSNLYARKRKGGIARGVVFAVWSVAGLAIGDATVLPGVLVLGAVSVSGFAQSGKYNAVNQQKAVEDYMAGKPLAAKIKSKFKEKDFR
ncbi:MAG: hypothetical protein DYG99_14325 [Bacteroidetes bacterium CHB5]|nr:hypothetical protein [Bacteroidetes bacterium CHB5]